MKQRTVYRLILTALLAVLAVMVVGNLQAAEETTKITIDTGRESGGAFMDLGEFETSVTEGPGITQEEVDQYFMLTFDLRPLSACNDIIDCAVAIRDACIVSGTEPASSTFDLADGTCDGKCSNGSTVTAVCSGGPGKQ